MLVAATLLPGLGPAEKRGPVDPAAWPWSAVVRVQIPGVSRCSGFLLDAVTVVTTAHCLFDVRVQHLLRPGVVHVLSGYSHGSYAAHAVVESYRVAPGYDPQHADRTRGVDVAVLHLPSPVGGRGLALVGTVPGQAAMLGGYERDRTEVMLADRDCRAMGIAADLQGRSLRQHSCAATYGSNGAPLLVRDASGEWAAAGVQEAASPGEAGGIAVPASVVTALLGSK